MAVARRHATCGSSTKTAKALGCSASWVRLLLQRQRQMGSLAPLPQRRPCSYKLDEVDLDHLCDLIRRKPDRALRELAEARDYSVNVPTVWRATKKLGLTLKKVIHASEQDRPDVAEARHTWFQPFAEVRLDQLVFLDAFGATSNRCRRYGRASIG